MSAQTVNTDALVAVLLPELRKLCANAPLFGEITLRASIHDNDIGRISLGIETSRRIASRNVREVKQ
jgi:hypothetical protein